VLVDLFEHTRQDEVRHAGKRREVAWDTIGKSHWAVNPEDQLMAAAAASEDHSASLLAARAWDKLQDTIPFLATV
jgi:hypothetical protein